MNTTDRIADLSMLWKQASMTFPYFDQRNIDWDRAYREYIPKVIDATTDTDFHLLLAEFMNLLGDGHTDYLLPKSLQDEIGYLPFTLRFTQDSYCIDAAISGYQAYARSQLLSINGIPFMTLIQEVKRYGCGGWMRICSVGYRLMDGTEFIGCGINPDIICEISVDDFVNGYDYVLSKGLEYMRKQRGGAL